jgi:hypothetical protein
MRRLLLVAAVATLVAGLVPAAAEEEAWEPNLRTEQVWFECGDDKVHVGDVTGPIPTWSTEPPSESVAAGAGCGALDTMFMQSAPGNLYDATWTGEFEGNLDAITIEAHNIYVGPARATGDFEVALKLFIDGQPMFDELGEHVIVPAERSSTGASESITFTVTDLGFTSERDDDWHWIDVVLHGGEARHRGPTATDTLSGWVWGTTEVPSGLVFNPEETADVVVSAGRG